MLFSNKILKWDLPDIVWTIKESLGKERANADGSNKTLAHKSTPSWIWSLWYLFLYNLNINILWWMNSEQFLVGQALFLWCFELSPRWPILLVIMGVCHAPKNTSPTRLFSCSFFSRCTYILYEGLACVIRM